MTSLFALRALLFAGELLAGSILIVALGWLVAARKAASARHLVWVAAFGVLLALPIFAALLPSTIKILLPAPAPLPHIPREVLLAAAAQTPPSAPSGFEFDLSTIVMGVAALWLLGAFVVALRLAAGALFLAVLQRRSRPFQLAPEDEPKIAARAQECELRLCDGEVGPLTWGIARPVILLPKSALEWPRERMQAVLLHELAHIRRRDSLTQALSQAACALYWPNPFVWMAAKQLRREAEIAADDWVIVAGVKPSHYAGELVALAKSFKSRGPAFASLSMAAPGALEARVKSLLSETQSRTGVTKMDILKTAGAGFFAAIALALACPSLAQEARAESDRQPAIAAVTAQPLPPVDMGAETNPPAMPPQEALPATPARVAQATPAEAVPDAPQAPDAPPAPPAPPPPPAAPDSMPALPALPAEPALPANGHMHIWIDGREVSHLTPEERARIRAEAEKARAEAHAAMEKVRPEIEHAMQDVARSHAAMAHAIAEAAAHRREAEQEMAEIQPKLEEALAKVRADLANQHLDARIQEHLDAALKRVEARIEIEQAREKAREERRDGEHSVTIRETDYPNGDRTEERTDTTDGK